MAVTSSEMCPIQSQGIIVVDALGRRVTELSPWNVVAGSGSWPPWSRLGLCAAQKL